MIGIRFASDRSLAEIQIENTEMKRLRINNNMEKRQLNYIRN